MKFLWAGPISASPKSEYFSESEYHTNSQVESWLHNTKDILNRHLPHICTPTNYNLTTQHLTPYGFLDKYIKSTVTMKPADKHLETVLLDTDDYTDLCLQHLTDTNIYRATPISPTQTSDSYLLTFLHATNQHCSHTVRLYTHFYSNARSIALPCFMDSPKSIKTSLASLQSFLL